jgi:hypothetical protein
MKRAKKTRDVKVTPSMRRKVDDLAVWLGEGDRVRVREARKTIVDLLCTAAGMTDTSDALRTSKARPRKRRT